MKRLARNVAQVWELVGLIYVSWRYARADARSRARRKGASRG